jgi:hypothetical protein
MASTGAAAAPAAAQDDALTPAEVHYLGLTKIHNVPELPSDFRAFGTVSNTTDSVDFTVSTQRLLCK